MGRENLIMSKRCRIEVTIAAYVTVNVNIDEKEVENSILGLSYRNVQELGLVIEEELIEICDVEFIK